MHLQIVLFSEKYYQIIACFSHLYAKLEQLRSIKLELGTGLNLKNYVANLRLTSNLIISQFKKKTYTNSNQAPGRL